jgi:hypothetical protein
MRHGTFWDDKALVPISLFRILDRVAAGLAVLLSEKLSLQYEWPRPKRKLKRSQRPSGQSSTGRFENFFGPPAVP